MLVYERRSKARGFGLIIGVDEAGRGPLAGPVVAAAVALVNSRFQNPIRDSKKISPAQRERAFLEIYQKAHVGVSIISEAVIDATNILKATHMAMTAAVRHLISRLPAEQTNHQDFPGTVCLLIDGNSFKSDLEYHFETIVGGDDRSRSIACASIIAKVTRDRILNIYDRIYPQYGFKNHKGYGTLTHRLAVKRYGPSLIHRKTFRWQTAQPQLGS